MNQIAHLHDYYFNIGFSMAVYSNQQPLSQVVVLVNNPKQPEYVGQFSAVVIL